MQFEDPHLYINRELSWLEFNQRVLDEAWDESNPLLERVKFLCIVSANLDEFFEIRVAGLQQQKQTSLSEIGPDGLDATQILHAIALRVRRLVEDQYRCWNEQLAPALEGHSIRFLHYPNVSEEDHAYLTAYFTKSVFPVLTPLAIDPVHPFPQLLNKSLNVVAELDAGDTPIKFAVVQVPRILARVVPLPRPKGVNDFVFLGNIVQHHAASLFRGVRVAGVHQFRVTRNSNLYFDEEESHNLLRAIETELRKIARGNAVRLEVQPDCPEATISRLVETFSLTPEEVFSVSGPINFPRLFPVIQELDMPQLKFRPFKPRLVIEDGEESIFTEIKKKDVLLHHPFDQFKTVVDLIAQAAVDDDVLAIKQTLYRTSGDSPLIPALMEAAQNGKQVTVVIELKARFDEAANVKWARMLQEAGVHVVYGVPGLKVHAKMALVVRREGDLIQRYAHLGTGNYNSATARLYTDLGLLTADDDLTNDCAELFNILTGVSIFPGLKKLLVAPFTLHTTFLHLIETEIENAAAGKASGISAKTNALVEQEIIGAFYRASSAGVPIRLLVRGVCCLRPGVPGISENIEARSVVGRFLEHSRIYRFENGGNPLIYLASADLMPRNFFRRVETCFPVEDQAAKDRVSGIFDLYWQDSVKARSLGSDGAYRRVSRRDPSFNVQEFLTPTPPSATKVPS